MKAQRVFNLIMLTTLIFMAFFSNIALGASVEDYKALKYATITNSGKDTVAIEGRGIMSVKVGSSPDDATAMIFKDVVDPKNFQAGLEFLKDYGEGSGLQAGWYSINLSQTPNWFTSVDSIIKANNLSGVNIIFKLDAMDKKKAFIEVAKYTPGSGFKSLMGSTIEVPLKDDWKCLAVLKAGKLYIDDTFITDLNDAIDISLPEGKAFAGFGGLSEEFKGIKMNVQLNATASKDDISKYVKATDTALPAANSSTPSSTAPIEKESPAVASDEQTSAASSNAGSSNTALLIGIGVLVIGGLGVILARRLKKSK